MLLDISQKKKNKKNIYKKPLNQVPCVSYQMAT